MDPVSLGFSVSRREQQIRSLAKRAQKLGLQREQAIHGFW
jgi:hypothetical protein